VELLLDRVGVHVVLRNWIPPLSVWIYWALFMATVVVANLESRSFWRAAALGFFMYAFAIAYHEAEMKRLNK
jgi:hypothetical protein